MTTIALAAGHCARGRTVDELTSECKSRVYLGYGKDDLYASDFLESKFQSLNMCVPLEHSMVRTRRKRLNVIARVKKGKKHDYPWPDDIDPNLKSGHLKYLSYFKPLEEKPKPVTLAFEKPLVDLELKIIEVRRMADETGLDFSNQINALELKYQHALADLYTHLTPIQRLNIARHPNRPTVLDHVLNITEKWVELHGDRAGYDDPAIITGLGSINGKTYMFIGHQKGRNTKENISRNFAMPTPHGYRKALRMMKYADHHGFPIITLIDTPGAYADLKSEELGQGEAIAQNIRSMFGLRVPIITIVTGEGGSGGALAIGCCNKLFMLENSAFYVASPEACAAILWKSAQAAPKAAEKLRITAQEHVRLKVADAIIPEPLGGAHSDPKWTSQQIKIAILQAMEELGKMSEEELLQHRMLKFRHIGGFQEGIPIDPKKKRKMKPSDVNVTTSADLEAELTSLKKIILRAKGSSDQQMTTQTIEKLQEDVDKEITKAFISMGLQGELESLKLELTKSTDPLLNLALKERADRLKQEFKLKLSKPGEYMGLKQKLAKLEAVNKIIERMEKGEKIKAEINEKVSANVKNKLFLLKIAQEKLVKGEEVDKEIVEQVETAKKELEEALQSSNLEIVGTMNAKLSVLNSEINAEIERAIDETGLREKIEELKEHIAGNSSFEKVKALQEHIKERIISVMNVESLKEKADNFSTESVSTPAAVLQGKLGADNGKYA
ncbi:acetyl-coenzyme A carboxylase carboxyl transferase subunit alpha, chloroplastic-like [Amaranthus tricolor]|uniref:acetyl-coenzyme A carboxylase carboxyl transferase subunit alpha, chloroplastic-like n=1 Tax=Amaranthus tricolor TaxID=29722 RepID=UPI00258B7298|nr:acetyl-coenzyme A carboxylase carboxyl transferase subunit alpha, chloroplastic-like [Amaranthus tricolor]